MSVAELKEKIISLVSEVEEEQILEECISLLKPEAGYYLELTDDDMREFDQIEKEVEQGEFYTHEEFKELMKHRLDRYDNG